MAIRAFLASWTPQIQALLRLVTAYLYITHGSAKHFGVPHVAAFDNLHVLSLVGLAGIIELVGSVLLFLGLFTRAAAFIMSGEMAVAYFMAHASKGHVAVPMLNGGELAVLYCFVFLFFAAAGPGAWSLDGLLRRKPA
jgi:putative oxidoreductase